jgi:hypothetical protein
LIGILRGASELSREKFLLKCVSPHDFATNGRKMKTRISKPNRIRCRLSYKELGMRAKKRIVSTPLSYLMKKIPTGIDKIRIYTTIIYVNVKL